MNIEILEITKKFHDTYEKLASEYTYETRKETRVFDINSSNGKLMYATVNEIISPILEENKQLKDNWNELKEYINKMHEYFLYTDVNEIYKQSMKLDNQIPHLFNLSELNASDRILSSICKKIQELEQGSDSNE